MVQRIFEGRIVNYKQSNQTEVPKTTQHRSGNDDPAVPLVKMFRCQAENPGCGLSKPANEFYKEIQEICSACANRLAQKHSIDLYWVPLVINCYAITRGLGAEANSLATPEGREKGYNQLVINHGIETGRNHFVRSMIEGTMRAPLEQRWAVSLHERYRAWIFDHYDIPKEKYSNLPKNKLLG